MTKLFKGILIAIICGVLVLVYSLYIEPKILVNHEYDLNKEKSGESQNIKVVQLSDIHISEDYTEKQLEKMVEKVNKLEPDIITFTGDLFDNYSKYGPVKETVEALGKLKAKYGKYSVWGNRDYGGGASRQYENIMRDSGFTLLKNEGVNIHIENGKKIFIGGLDDALLGNLDVDNALRKMKKDSDYKIMLMHEPDKADVLKDSELNLILAGHSHGGQVKIPLLKRTKTALAKKYISGFYTINEKTQLKLYVNTGIGTTRIPVRFMVPPEISIFNIAI